MLPPTSYLPPIKDIGIHPLKVLNDALYYLRRIYNPEVRGSRRRRAALLYVPAENGSSGELDALRIDSFERRYAIKWLMALISRFGNDSQLTEESEAQDDSQPSTEDLIQNAASLLAICAGTASAGVVVRQFVFECGYSSEDDHDISDLIKVELVDVPLDNHDYRSVGAQTWGGACIMAEMIVEQPRQFCLYPIHTRDDDDTKCSTLRCLELGAGTGLVSLTIAKMMQKLIPSTDTTSPKFEVVATDYYPSVLSNLERNIYSNFPEPSSSTSVRVSTRALDWCTFNSETTHDPMFETPFDLILGADIIYESQHALWIKSCLTKLLRKPSATTLSDISPTFHLVIPLRSTHTVESNTIEQVFPFNNHDLSDSSGCLQLVINVKEIIICDAESGKEGEDVEYAYYKIGWDIL